MEIEKLISCTGIVYMSNPVTMPRIMSVGTRSWAERNTKVRTSSFESPEQVIVLLSVGIDDTSICQNDLERPVEEWVRMTRSPHLKVLDIVCRETILSGEVEVSPYIGRSVALGWN